jgi:hypothetical protein
MKTILLALGIAVLSTVVVAQPRGPSDHDRVLLNPQPLPPDPPDRHGRRDRTGDVMLNPQPLPPGPDDRDWKNYRRWDNHRHTENYNHHHERISEIRIGQQRSEVLAFPWWRQPLYTRTHGRFTDYVYAQRDGDLCFLRFRKDHLVSIHCQ